MPSKYLGNAKTDSEGNFTMNFDYKLNTILFFISYQAENSLNTILLDGVLESNSTSETDLGNVLLFGTLKPTFLEIFKTGSAYEIGDRIIIRPMNSLLNISDTVLVNRKTTLYSQQMNLLFTTVSDENSIKGIRGGFFVTHINGSKRNNYQASLWSEGLCTKHQDTFRIKLEN